MKLDLDVHFAIINFRVKKVKSTIKRCIDMNLWVLVAVLEYVHKF